MSSKFALLIILNDSFNSITGYIINIFHPSNWSVGDSDENTLRTTLTQLIKQLQFCYV